MDYIVFKGNFNNLLHSFISAETLEEQNNYFKEFNKQRLLYEGTKNLLRINHFSDLSNVKAREEDSNIQHSEPGYLSLVNDYYEAILSAVFRTELEGLWGVHLFKLAEIKIKTFNKGIAEEVDRENKLVSEYQQIFSKAESMFRGEAYLFLH
ncbi:hypothetical protein [Paenisporosarcina sp. TG20]|uniref:hypothetical protein n=1 Tax=Paenisporosarcina sp. TG20 TaxID=1211706 RepID=UPI00037617AD|nr:hypothetical protein [Paenisporosarcina sp. TG20]